MKSKLRIVFLILASISAFLLCGEDLYAYTLSYDQSVKSPFGPEMNMKVWYKDDSLRVEMNPAGRKIVNVVNETGMYTYLPSRNIATKINKNAFNGEYIKHPEKYVDNIERLGARRTGSELIDGEECDVYEYTDEASGSEVTAYVSEIKALPLKMVIMSSFGTTEIIFSNIKVGVELPDELFCIPPEAKIIDTTAF